MGSYPTMGIFATTRLIQKAISHFLVRTVNPDSFLDFGDIKFDEFLAIPEESADRCN